VSQGGTVIQQNDLSPEMEKRLRKIKDEKNPRKSFVKRTGELTPTNIDVKLDKVVKSEDYDDDTTAYVAMVERVAPMLINRTVTVRVVDDDEAEIQGCYKYVTGEMYVNLTYHDTSNPSENFELMIHEL
jgi:hypothetical protein